MSSVIESNDTGEILKRGRGRPRKETSKPNEPIEPIEKRSRGRPKQENPWYKTKESRKDLYHAHKRDFVCEVCGKKLTNSDSFRYHSNFNKSCFILKMLHMEDIKENLIALDSKVVAKYNKLLEDIKKEQNE